MHLTTLLLTLNSLELLLHYIYGFEHVHAVQIVTLTHLLMSNFIYEYFPIMQQTQNTGQYWNKKEHH